MVNGECNGTNATNLYSITHVYECTNGVQKVGKYLNQMLLVHDNSVNTILYAIYLTLSGSQV